MEWTEGHEEAFKNLKEVLVQASALTLPDVTKPFHLYVHEGINGGQLWGNRGK